MHTINNSMVKESKVSEKTITKNQSEKTTKLISKGAIELERDHTK